MNLEILKKFIQINDLLSHGRKTLDFSSPGGPDRTRAIREGGMRYAGEHVFASTIQSSTNLEEQP